MTGEKIFASVVVVIVLCCTALISQCTYSVKECRVEALKAGKNTAEITHLCQP